MNEKNMFRKLTFFLLIILFSRVIAVGANESTLIKVHLFYTNDLRGGIEEQKASYLNPQFPPVLGGGASAATIIKAVRKAAAEKGDIVLLADGGDFFEGPPALGRNSRGAAIVEYMNAVGYDALVPGINDFKYGTANLLRLAEQAGFPFVAANLFNSNNLSHFSQIAPYVLIEKRGLKIGLFGVVSKSAEVNNDSAAVAEVVFGPEIESARKAVAALQSQGADLIIALAHLGLPYDPQEGYQVLSQMDAQNLTKESYVNAMELAHYVPGIDVIVSGKARRGYNTPWEDPVHHTICVQNYANGGNLGLLTLNIDLETRSIFSYELPSVDGGLLLLTEDEFWPDAEVEAVIRQLQQKYAPEFDEIIGVTRTTLYRSSQGESPMSNLMCDAMVEASGADFAFNNFVSMRRDIPIGPITPRDISQVFPFGNQIAVITMKGALLKKLLEASVENGYSGMAIGGGQVVYDPQRPDGNKIIEFLVQGKPLDEDATYKVATTEYLAEGNYGMTPLAFLPEDRFTWTGTTVRDAVVQFVKKHSPLQIMEDGRWVRK